MLLCGSFQFYCNCMEMSNLHILQNFSFVFRNIKWSVKIMTEDMLNITTDFTIVTLKKYKVKHIALWDTVSNSLFCCVLCTVCMLYNVKIASIW